MTRRRAVITAATAATLAVALVGAMHLPFARAWLGRVGGGVCPVAPLDPVAREEGRRRAVASLAGKGAAPAKPALGFRLGETPEARVRAWILTEGLRCEDARGGSTVTCVDVPPAALPDGARAAPLTRVSFRFDPSSRLVAVVAVRDALAAEVAVASLERSRDALARELGPATSVVGQASASWLEAGDLRQARVEHRFSDYYAAVAATRIGRNGVAVTEEYQLVVQAPGDG